MPDLRGHLGGRLPPCLLARARAGPISRPQLAPVRLLISLGWCSLGWLKVPARPSLWPGLTGHLWPLLLWAGSVAWSALRLAAGSC